MRHVRIIIPCIGLALGMPAVAAHAAVVEVSQALGKAGTNSDIGFPTIVVDGAGNTQYDRVVTQDVDAWIRVKGETPANGRNPSNPVLDVEGKTIAIGVPGEAKVWKITFPYRDPRSTSVGNQRVSPVDLCNQEIQKRQGAARTAYLKDGGSLLRKDAYKARASVNWAIKDTKGVFKDPDAIKSYSDETLIGVNIQCRPLDRPKVRTSKSTDSTGLNRRGPRAKKADPTIKSASLRMQPAKAQRFGSDNCPTQLKLYGQVVTNRAFHGAAILLGSGYLSPVTSLDFSGAGTQSVRGTYPLKWEGGPSGTLAVGGKPAPKSQVVTLRMNVATQDKKVIETVSETVKVTCERAQPTRTSAPTPQRTNGQPRRVAIAAGHAAPAQDFDARIRRVDRQGPGGTIQLWAYNAGPDNAVGCSIGMRTNPGDSYQQVAAVATIGAGQTVTIGAGQTVNLPGAPGSAFNIDCPDEPEGARANNGYMLDE
ncbi:hypothetical protein [Lysobacter sp. F6437]|uniref:hypothetical protein n=1 Tax=Lysobacter sp. F6437 TaxID=3459296 RepID=UPI00403E3055